MLLMGHLSGLLATVIGLALTALLGAWALDERAPRTDQQRADEVEALIGTGGDIS